MTDARMRGIDPPVVGALDVRTGRGSSRLSLGMAEDAVVFDGQLLGAPSGHAERWFEQVHNGFCHPATIAQLVSQYVGVDVRKESEFLKRANELKVFDVGPDGVPGIGIDGALVLLEDAGVPVYIEIGSGEDTLVDYHGEGRRVILAVGSRETRSNQHSEDGQGAWPVVVTGVDAERDVVLVALSSDAEGNSIEYPMSELEAAWADSGFAALACDIPPEQRSVHPAGEGDDPSEVGSASNRTIPHPWVVLPVVLGTRAVPPGGRGRRA